MGSLGTAWDPMSTVFSGFGSRCGRYFHCRGPHLVKNTRAFARVFSLYLVLLDKERKLFSFRETVTSLGKLSKMGANTGRGEKTVFAMGTIINAAAIVVGGVIGLVGGKRLPTRCQEMILRAMGVCVMFVGIAGTLEQMLVIENGTLTVRGTLMLVISMALGCLIGELLNLDGAIERFGYWLRKISGNGEDNRFLDGFVCTTMTVCIGAMAIVGAVQDGIYGDSTTLIAKSLMDFVVVLIMASSMGKGCLFAAIPVVVLQGSVTALARLIEPVLTVAALSNLSLVGSVLIFCVGINLIWKNTLRLANLLPALVAAVFYLW